MSRIKKIIQLDEDIAQCSHNATFLIAIATVSYHKEQFVIGFSAYRCFQELFIQYIAEQGYNVVKSERKPRKTIQYRDLGMNLFLT